MSREIKIVGNLVKVEFSTDTMPIVLEKKNKDFLLFGEENNYPSFLIELYKKHAAHNAIIKAKSKYIYGKGLTINKEKNLNYTGAEMFLSKANRYEDWNSVYDKTVKALEIFNGFVWQIIWNLGGTSCEVYCLQFANFRVSKCGKKVMYCKNWVQAYPEKDDSYKVYDAFNPNVRIGTQIYYYVVQEQVACENDSAYPYPEYIGCVTNIATDVAVKDFQNSLVENGMTAQGMLNLFNGIPTDEEKKKFHKLFTKDYTGPNKAGSIILNFSDPGVEGAKYESFAVSDLDKQFDLILKTNQQDIVTGHQIPNKALVGISVEGALSNRTEIVNSYDQMYNTYVEPRQNISLTEIKMIAKTLGVDLSGLEVVKLSPLGVDFLDPNVSKYFTTEEIRAKLGEKPLNQPLPGQEASVQAVNENLKRLTGKDWIHIKRLVREVSNGKTTREAAAMMLKNGYALADEDINILFSTPAQMSKFIKDISVLELFEAYATDENEKDEFVSEEFCFNHVGAKMAFLNQNFKMGEPSKEIQNSILDILKGNPFTPVSVIAKQLGIEADYVEITIESLKKGGLISSGDKGSLVPTDKGIDKNAPPVEVEIYTVYKYSLRPDVSYDGNPNQISKELLSTSHDFCKKMIAMANSGKVFTREALDSLTNDIGQDAWVYRGGFTNHKNGEVTPYCNHVYKAITRRRVKNA